jgi:hypothetical protein
MELTEGRSPRRRSARRFPWVRRFPGMVVATVLAMVVATVLAMVVPMVFDSDNETGLEDAAGERIDLSISRMLGFEFDRDGDRRLGEEGTRGGGRGLVFSWDGGGGIGE